MNARPDLDRRITAWLEELAPERASDRLIESSRERLDTTTQRRVFGALARRSPNMNSLAARMAAAAAVVLAVGIAAWTLLPGSSGPGGPAMPSPTPTPLPSGALLAPGTYTTTLFKPAITFTVPEGWRLAWDSPAELRLVPSVVNGDISACVGPLAMRADGSGRAPVGTTSGQLIAWLADQTAILTVDLAPASISVAGLSGMQVTVKGHDELGESQLFTHDAGGTCAVNLYGAEWTRFIVLDVPGPAETLLINVRTFGDSSQEETLMERGSEIVATFKVGS